MPCKKKCLSTCSTYILTSASLTISFNFGSKFAITNPRQNIERINQTLIDIRMN